MAKKKPEPTPKVPTPPPPAPLSPSTTTRFDRDVERLRRRGLDLGKLRAVIEELCSRRPLPASYQDHPLKGEWQGCRDCHVAPDWIVIYERGETVLTLIRTGTHADLFE